MLLYIPVGHTYLPLRRHIATAEDSSITTWQMLLRYHRLLGRKYRREAGG